MIGRPRRALRGLLPLLLLGSPASAQPDLSSARFAINPIRPASPHSPFLTTEGPVRPQQLPKPWLGASVVLDYARAPLTLDVHANGTHTTVPLVSHALVAHLGISAHLTDALSVDLAIPAALMQAGDRALVAGTLYEAGPAPALGDASASVLLRPWWGNVQPLIGVRAWGPTGSADAFMGDDRFHFEGLLGAAAGSDRLRFACTVFGAPTYGSAQAGERLAASCALDHQRLAGRPRVGLELFGAFRRIGPDFDATRTAELWATLRQQVGALHMTLAGGPGTGSSPGTAAVRVFARFSYLPQPDGPGPAPAPSAPADRDMDGIPDAGDACPGEAGPASNRGARHGCPHMDSDGDGIDDTLDACPDNAGSRTDVQETTGCPDRDNDRFVDKLDRCPDEPAPPYPGAAEPGCPRHAVLRGERFSLRIQLAAEPELASASIEQDVLRDIAFTLRAIPSLRLLAVEVHWHVDRGDSEDEAALRAVARAQGIIDNLVDLGVEAFRLKPVGAASPSKSEVRVVVIERDAPKQKRK